MNILEVSRVIVRLYIFILPIDYNINIQYHYVIFDEVINSFNVTFIIMVNELTKYHY